MAKVRFVGHLSETGKTFVIWIPKGYHEQVKHFRKKQVRITIDDEFLEMTGHHYHVDDEVLTSHIMKGLLVGFEILMLVLSMVVINQNIYAVPSNATIAATKTYQDFGLGFKIEYPSNMTIEKGSDNVTLHTPGHPANAPLIRVFVSSWAKALGLSGLFTPPNLDTLARQVSLEAVSNATTQTTVTNKTKVVVDNTPAYLLQTEENYNGKPLYKSLYLILRESIVYVVAIGTTDQAKLLPLEHKIIQSFRFV